MYIIIATLISIATASFQPPAFTGPVVDEAQMLNTVTAEWLGQKLESIYAQGGPQIAVLTLESLNQNPLENVSIDTSRAWGLGDAEKDNGILLLISRKERQIRIEVGQGLEGEITDLLSHRAINEIMVPAFKSGDVDTGVVNGLNYLLSNLDKPISLGNKRSRVRGRRKKSVNWSKLLFLLFILVMLGGSGQGPLFFLYMLAGGNHRGPRGGGGFGGFGGGGGFSGGGGGGFSGGGASGSW